MRSLYTYLITLRVIIIPAECLAIDCMSREYQGTRTNTNFPYWGDHWTCIRYKKWIKM